MSKSRLLDRMSKAKAVNSPTDSTLKAAIDSVSKKKTDQSVSMDVDPSSIKSDYNPREFPITLDEIQAIDWPSLDTPLDELEQKIEAAINSSAFEHLKVSLRDRDILLGFLLSIHNLAVRIKAESQIHEVTVRRSSVTASDFKLIAGERRLAAFFYAKGALNKIRCRVHSADISGLQIANIRDGENHRDDLAFYEIVASKYEIWKALDESKKTSLSVSQLAIIWGYNSRGTPTLLTSVFRSPDAAELVDLIYSKRMKKDEVEQLVKSLKSNVAGPNKPKVKKEALINKRADAKHYGLNLTKKTDISVTQLALKSLIDGDQLPAKVREQLSQCSLHDPKGLNEAWAIIGNALEVLNET